MSAILTIENFSYCEACQCHRDARIGLARTLNAPNPSQFHKSITAVLAPCPRLERFLVGDHNAAMPWLLYRYMIRDLLRVIGLTTSVLVTVIAFGAMIKPLASNSLLDAGQTAKYLGLVIVPMLQFA